MRYEANANTSALKVTRIKEYQTTFTNWMQQYGKSYASDEFQSRFSIFKNNMNYVRDWNAAGSATVRKYSILAR
jgi:cathepsin L